LFPRSRQREFGIEDLAGNVWEWCLNKYDEPDDIALDDSGAWRVLRGGSWLDGRDDARAGYSGYGRPYYRGVGGGFRVVCASPIR
jgi:formylglycine-generating enzyme required for sulfatase activity